MAIKKTPESTVIDGEVQDFQLTLEEFCTRLSVTDKRVEMIGAFAFTEKKAGNQKDLESNFAARFADFVNAPA